MSKNRFFRLFAGVLGFIGFLVLRRPLIERYGYLFAGIPQHFLASSLSAALTFSVVGATWSLYRYVRRAIVWKKLLPANVATLDTATCLLLTAFFLVVVMAYVCIQTAMGTFAVDRGLHTARGSLPRVSHDTLVKSPITKRDNVPNTSQNKTVEYKMCWSPDVF